MLLVINVNAKRVWSDVMLQVGLMSPAMDTTFRDCEMVFSKLRILKTFKISHAMITRLLVIERIPPVAVGNFLRPL